jgi:hypothetical protein
MKALTLVLLLTLAMETCGQSLEKISSISFTKQTRGFLDEMIISRDSVQGFVENHRIPENSQQYATGIDSDDWTKLMLTLKDVSLEEIDGLQSPTMNRAHDGAIHSNIIITFEDGNSVTHSFDDEKPHPDLQPLLDAILEFRLPARK